MKKSLRNISVLTAFLILLDQITKYLAATNLKTNFSIIGDFFQLQYSENTGIAFGIPIPQVILIIANTLLIIAIVYLVRKELSLRNRLTQICTALILAGGMGNLTDRIFRGFVIDFISIWKWPTFNLADTYIVVGILLIIIFYGKVKKT